MSVEQFQQTLIDSHNSSQDPTIQELAKTAHQYTELVKSSQISKEEYIELMEDIQRQASINNSADHQQLLTHMNTAINGLINLAKLV